MWSTRYPSFGRAVYTLWESRMSLVHFGKCGLHQGHEDNKACIDNGMMRSEVEDIYKVVNIKPV